MNRLRETASEINKATSDPLAQNKLQRSWNLQDLLAFPEDVLSSHKEIHNDANVSQSTSSSYLRVLGHAKLCGALFVVYQANDGMHGQYMLCALFLRHLLLAIPEAGSKRFKVVAVINTVDLQIEPTDDGRGGLNPLKIAIACHTNLCQAFNATTPCTVGK